MDEQQPKELDEREISSDAEEIEAIGNLSAKLSESFSRVNSELPIKAILEKVEDEYRDLKGQYVEICRRIQGEMFSLLNRLNDRKIKSAMIDIELLERSRDKKRYCSIYSKVPPLHEMQNDEEYDFFSSKYNEVNILTKEISEINLMIMRLVGVQKSLDHAYASSMIESDYVTRRMEETLKTAKCMKTPDFLENYKNKRCFYKDLQKMIEEKNEEYSSALSKSTKSLNKDELSLVGNDKL